MTDTPGLRMRGFGSSRVVVVNLSKRAPRDQWGMQSRCSPKRHGISWTYGL